MADILLTARLPLTNRLVPGVHGTVDGEPGVRLRIPEAVVLHGVLALRNRLGELRQAVADAGFALPDAGRFVERDACHLLWAGPDQWTIAAEGSAGAVAERLATACRPLALVAAQSDARAVIEVSGPKARAMFAKLIGVDLHPRAFGPGQTALTPAGGIPLQLWQTGDTPAYMVAVPRSFAEDFWGWLTRSAAEFGYQTIQPAGALQPAQTR